MNQNLTAEQQARRDLEDQYPPGYFTRHIITERRYFIYDSSPLGFHAAQAVNGYASSQCNVPKIFVPWERADHYTPARSA